MTLFSQATLCLILVKITTSLPLHRGLELPFPAAPPPLPLPSAHGQSLSKSRQLCLHRMSWAGPSPPIPTVSLLLAPSSPAERLCRLVLPLGSLLSNQAPCSSQEALSKKPIRSHHHLLLSLPAAVRVEPQVFRKLARPALRTLAYCSSFTPAYHPLLSLSFMVPPSSGVGVINPGVPRAVNPVLCLRQVIWDQTVEGLTQLSHVGMETVKSMSSGVRGTWV